MDVLITYLLTNVHAFFNSMPQAFTCQNKAGTQSAASQDDWNHQGKEGTFRVLQRFLPSAWREKAL